MRMSSQSENNFISDRSAVSLFSSHSLNKQKITQLEPFSEYVSLWVFLKIQLEESFILQHGGHRLDTRKTLCGDREEGHSVRGGGTLWAASSALWHLLERCLTVSSSKGSWNIPRKSLFWHCLPLKLFYFKTKQNKIKRKDVENFTLCVCSDAEHVAYSLRVTQ